MTLGLLSIMLTAYYQYSTFNTFPYDAQHWSIFSHLLPACTTILSVNKRAKDSSAQGRGVQMLRAQTLFLGCEIWWIQTNQLFHSSQLTSVCVGIARQWEGSYYPSFTWERAEADNHLKYQLIFDCPFWPAFELACGENLRGGGSLYLYPMSGTAASAQHFNKPTLGYREGDSTRKNGIID